ncbi:MAG: AtpZ/AtpI family protein [Lachnospiraceae bacterium]|nr:AtpZ/AtpI family protein [Lachnospiraceae bacterium]
MMISQFGINMLVPIFLCSFIGIAIDKRCGTSFWVVILFFIGAAAGFRNVYRFARKIYEKPAQTRIHMKGEQKEAQHGKRQEDKN